MAHHGNASSAVGSMHGKASRYSARNRPAEIARSRQTCDHLPKNSELVGTMFSIMPEPLRDGLPLVFLFVLNLKSSESTTRFAFPASTIWKAVVENVVVV